MPTLASLLLHGSAVLALAALHHADRLPTAQQETGVEVVWRESQEDSAPGEESAAPPVNAETTTQDALPGDPSPEDVAEAPPPPEPETPDRQPSLEPSQPPSDPVLADASVPEPPPQSAPVPEPSPPQPVLIEAPVPEPPPPRPAFVEAPAPEAEPPPQPTLAETPAPVPPPGPALALTPLSEAVPPLPFEARPPLALPRPPPATPAPPRAAPRPQAPSQVASAAVRQAAPGPATPPDASGGSRATGAVVPPGLLDGVRNPEPEYPFASRQRGDQGAVTVLLRISETGQVLEAEIISTSGHRSLDDSVLRTAPRLRYRAATRNGMPVPGSLRATYHFRLQ